MARAASKTGHSLHRQLGLFAAGSFFILSSALVISGLLVAVISVSAGFSASPPAPAISCAAVSGLCVSGASAAGAVVSGSLLSGAAVSRPSIAGAESATSGV